jgi:hypothetical protein
MQRRKNRDQPIKRIKLINKLALIADISTHTCFFGFFCSVLADSSLRTSSPGFTEGWYYIGVITAIIFFFVLIINITVWIIQADKESRKDKFFSSVTAKPRWTNYTKIFALVTLIAAGILFQTTWAKRFPLVLGIGTFFLMVSNFFYKRGVRSKYFPECFRYCHYEFLLSLLFLPQIFSLITLYVHVNGFVTVSNNFLLESTITSLVCAFILIAMPVIQRPYSIERIPTYDLELSNISEEPTNDEQSELKRDEQQPII